MKRLISITCSIAIALVLSILGYWVIPFIKDVYIEIYYRITGRDTGDSGWGLLSAVFVFLISIILYILFSGRLVIKVFRLLDNSLDATREGRKK